MMTVRQVWPLSAALLLLACGFLLGLRFADARHHERNAEREARFRQQQQASDARLYALGQRLQVQQQQHAATLQAMENALDDYRQKHRQRVALPAAWRVQHDRAAMPAATPPASPAIATPAATDDLAALDTISRNYALCGQWRDALIGWQDWYAEASRLQSPP